MFTSKKKQLAQLKANFGKLKDESFDFNKIGRFFLLSDKSLFHQVISDRTFQDLDMSEVFMFVDRTTSKIGQQFLYQTLRTIPGDRIRVDKFEEIIRKLKIDPEARDKVLEEISSLNERDAYYVASLFLENHLQKPKWFWVIPLLSMVSICSVLLSFFVPKVLVFLVLLMAVNFGIHYWNKSNLFRYSSSIPQLLILNRVAKKITAVKGMADLHPGICESIMEIDNLGMQMSLFKLEVKLQSEIVRPLNILLSL